MKFFLNLLSLILGKTKKSMNSNNVASSMIKSLKRRNFQPYEFFRSDTAKRLGIDNSTDDLEVLANLAIVADKIQEIRDLLNFPIKVNSCYRCLDLNRAVGSKDTSQHIKGQAIDFVCPQFGNPANIVSYLKERGIEVDQCIQESSWVHLSVKLEGNRNQYASLIDGVFKLA